MFQIGRFNLRLMLMAKYCNSISSEYQFYGYKITLSKYLFPASQVLFSFCFILKFYAPIEDLT